MEVLKLASCMAENTEVFCQALAIYVQRQLGAARNIWVAEKAQRVSPA